MRFRSNLLALMSVVGGVLLCGVATASAQSPANAVSAALLERFEVVSGYVLAAAETVAGDQYSHRPTDEVRNLGELFAHVAVAQFAYCAGLSGQAMPAAARGQVTAKAEIIQRVRESRDFCLEVYRGATDDSLAETIPLLEEEQTRAWGLIQNIAHDNLHYGNIVTYMRELGLVPPSSE